MPWPLRSPSRQAVPQPTPARSFWRFTKPPARHLRGDAAPLAAAIGDKLLLAENGGIRVQTKEQVAQFFAGYFSRVRYSEWRDVSPPVVQVSPDGRMGWMAVEVEARYSRADKPDEGEKSFKSSWIATYERDNCEWRMTGIASDVVD